MDDNNKALKAQKRLRSPNYPIIPLGKAIENVRQLYIKYHTTGVPVSVAIEALSFSSKSSKAAQMIAALGYYGLVSSEGSGNNKRIKITDLGFKILKSPDTLERDASIKIAALTPPIFKKIVEKFPQRFPEQSILSYELERAEKINPNRLREFINVFTQTINFAKIYESGIMGQEKTIIKEPDMPNTDKEPIKEPTDSAKDFLFSGPPKTPKIIEIPMPLSLTESVKIQATYPLSEKAWQQMLNILNAYKPSLVPLEDKSEDDKKEN